MTLAATERDREPVGYLLRGKSLCCELALPAGTLRISGKLTPELLQTLIRENGEGAGDITPAGSRIWLVAGVHGHAQRLQWSRLPGVQRYVADDDLFSGHLFIFRGRRGGADKGAVGGPGPSLCMFTKGWNVAASSGR